MIKLIIAPIILCVPKYIKKAVYTNPGYKNLPTRSPGFEDEDL